MSRERAKHYTLVYKQKAVELSYARGSVKQISQEMDISLSVLHRWRRELKEYGKNSFPGKGKIKQTDDQKEIAELRR
jgi:transposase